MVSDVARLQSFIGGMVRNGQQSSSNQRRNAVFHKVFLCVEKIRVCLCARAGVCVKREM